MGAVILYSCQTLQRLDHKTMEVVLQVSIHSIPHSRIITDDYSIIQVFQSIKVILLISKNFYPQLPILYTPRTVWKTTD